MVKSKSEMNTFLIWALMETNFYTVKAQPHPFLDREWADCKLVRSWSDPNIFRTVGPWLVVCLKNWLELIWLEKLVRCWAIASFWSEPFIRPDREARVRTTYFWTEISQQDHGPRTRTIRIGSKSRPSDQFGPVLLIGLVQLSMFLTEFDSSMDEKIIRL